MIAIVAVLAAVATIGGTPRRYQLRAQMTVDEFTRSGLQKLSDEELAALEGWLNGKALPTTLRSLAPVLPPNRFEAPAASGDPLVAFNTKSRKYHCPTCMHALQCTKNCIEVRLSEAVRRGGDPCGACGGCR